MGVAEVKLMLMMEERKKVAAEGKMGLYRHLISNNLMNLVNLTT